MFSRAPVTQPAAGTRFRRELGALLLLAIPVVLSELGWMAMSIVDTIMVGRLSPAAIGAVGISSAIFYTPALFGIGLLLGLDTLVAQAFGRGDFDDCHRSLAQGVYLAIGKDVKPGSAITSVQATDIAGRVARWLGMSKPAAAAAAGISGH